MSSRDEQIEALAEVILTVPSDVPGRGCDAIAHAILDAGYRRIDVDGLIDALNTAQKLIESFRRVEFGGERLYDAATHRWVDLLALKIAALDVTE